MGTSLAVQKLRLCASTAEDTGLIPSRETKILKTMSLWSKKKKTLLKYVRKGEWTKDLINRQFTGDLKMSTVPMKLCSFSLVTREMQVKTIIRKSNNRKTVISTFYTMSGVIN